MRRIPGIDIARGLALLGMFVSHAAPPIGGGGLAAFLIEVPDERSRLLFALTAGLGLGLLTGGSKPPGREFHGQLRRQIAIRAVCLLALGLLLQDTGVLVLVILDEYGVAFLVMLPFLFLPARWLLGLGAVLLAVAPGAAMALDLEIDDPGPYAMLTNWFISGAYPVFTWVAVFLLAVGVVRLGVTRPEVVGVAGGLGLVALGGGLATSIALGGDGIAAEPSAARVGTLVAALGTSAFTIGNVGFGVALTALLIALTGPLARVLAPIAAAGAMPLTVYTAHLMVLRAVTHEIPGGLRTDDGWPVLIALVIGTLTLPWLWQRTVGRGPLEQVIGWLSGRAERPRTRPPISVDSATGPPAQSRR